MSTRVIILNTPAIMYINEYFTWIAVPGYTLDVTPVHTIKRMLYQLLLL